MPRIPRGDREARTLVASACLAIFAALNCPSFAVGQTGNIHGAVVDSATRAPLSGVHVTALDRSATVVARTVTDGRGRFRLTALASAHVTLLFSRLGSELRRLETPVPAAFGSLLEVALASPRVTLDPVQVTASRAPETALDAPVAVSVVSRRDIEQSSAFTPAEYLRGVPGVDFISTGLVQNGFAVRGRNGATQGFLLMMTDYRNAALPSLGSNVSLLLPFAREDLEQIEVVRGPGAALYGVDAHRGVVHFLTRSPFESRGASLSVSAGERSILQATARVAAAPSPRFGFTVSGDYFQGRDWAVPTNNDTLRSDKGARRAGGQARLDWRLDSTTTIVATVGAAQAISALALTGAGHLQARDWRYSFAQTRLHRGRLFANLTYNLSDAGDTYLLRSNAPIVDNSRQVAILLQHGTETGRYDLWYGLDARWTDPRTDRTVHGANEDNDQVTEVGAYLQANAALSAQVDLVTAVRADRNDRLADLSISPRAGVVFRPAPAHALRLTYNRAFSAPDPAQLFQDLRTRTSLAGLPYGVWSSSIPRGGYTFSRDSMRSPLNPAGPQAYLPLDATLLWDSVVAIMARRSRDLSGIPAPSGLDVPTRLGALDARSLTFPPLTFNPADPSRITDFAPLRRSFTQTLELGYKGVFAGRVVVAVDGYVSRVRDPFGNPFAATPNAFLDSTTLAQYLSNFRPADSAAQLAGAISRVPLGTISPRETPHPVDVLILQRQGGAYTVGGVDLSVAANITSRIQLTGSYSWASNDVITDVPVVGTIVLNVPTDKGAITMRYRHERIGLTAALQGRAVGAFPVSGGGTVDIAGYAVVDAHVGYQLERPSGIALSLDAYNLLDHRHRETVGGGRLGRLVVSRLQVRF